MTLPDHSRLLIKTKRRRLSHTQTNRVFPPDIFPSHTGHLDVPKYGSKFQTRGVLIINWICKIDRDQICNVFKRIDPAKYCPTLFDSCATSRWRTALENPLMKAKTDASVSPAVLRARLRPYRAKAGGSGYEHSIFEYIS